ncbi:hypothetical protein KW787_00225 [Candidatus Pacearchaeota archaeon]|nr:hypothetical protein [Candidatus Pacearchaeota archaeon]
MKKINSLEKKKEDKIGFSNLPKNDKILFIILSILWFAALIFLFYYFLDISRRNFGALEVAMFVFLIVAAAYFSIVFYILVIYDHFMALPKKFLKLKSTKNINNKKFNHWLYISISLMIFLAIVGTLSLDIAIGNNFQKLNLLNESFSPVGTIKCKSSSSAFLVGDIISCNIESRIKITNKTDMIRLTLRDDSIRVFSLEEGYFIPPQGVKYIYFERQGIDARGNFRKFTVGYPEAFLDETEFRQHKQKFITYMFGLLSLIFITTPAAILCLRSLYRDD